MSEADLLREINDLKRRLAYFESGSFLAGRSGTWTPTVVGFSGSPTVEARYVLIGKLCIISVRVEGTSNATNLTVTAPFTSANTVEYRNGSANCMDNSVNVANGFVYLPVASNVI